MRAPSPTKALEPRSRRRREGSPFFFGQSVNLREDARARAARAHARRARARGRAAQYSCVANIHDQRAQRAPPPPGAGAGAARRSRSAARSRRLFYVIRQVGLSRAAVDVASRFIVLARWPGAKCCGWWLGLWRFTYRRRYSPRPRLYHLRPRYQTTQASRSRDLRIQRMRRMSRPGGRRSQPGGRACWRRSPTTGRSTT